MGIVADGCGVSVLDFAYRLIIFIIFVICEQLLEAFFLEELNTILEVVLRKVFLSILTFKINLTWWIKWRFHFVAVKGLPVKILKPRMYFNFRWAVGTETLDWLPFNKPIYKINGLGTPAFWGLVRTNFALTGKNHVSDFFPSSSIIGSATHHTFICDYADCIIINTDPMILLAHDFWGHVAGCAAALFGVVFLP